MGLRHLAASAAPTPTQKLLDNSPLPSTAAHLSRSYSPRMRNPKTSHISPTNPQLPVEPEMLFWLVYRTLRTLPQRLLQSKEAFLDVYL